MGQERAEKFNELLKKELGKIVFEFLDVKPGVLVTVTRVLTHANLFSAIVFISVFPTSETTAIMDKLKRTIYQIQQLLNKKLKVRPVPKIIFKRDTNPEEAGEVEKLLNEVREEIKDEK
ncbi:MAG: 30S ribosome-binding factor RbfA [Candidatus Azambacteria bacterium]|nr:30S ribosome-binding factor RbfA [Candidatus Azambacteria bacterium]